jgi:hypothetical protein
LETKVLDGDGFDISLDCFARREYVNFVVTDYEEG